MDLHRILSGLEQGLGVALVSLVLLDVFLTVLYARMGTGIASRRLACVLWYLFRAATRPMRRRRALVLSYCGPVILVMLVGLWTLALTCGMAMVIHPKMGTSIVANNGPTPRSFAVAMYVSGDALTTVGASDISPITPFFRLFYTFCSVTGISVLTLTLTYFLEVYNALQRRNTFALKVHLASGETADGADLVAGLGPRGQFTAGYSQIAEMAAEVASLKESHHFYPVIFYFRFREPYYALSRFALLSLDTVTLIKSGLDDEELGWLKESVAVNQLWRGTMHMLTLLSEGFLPSGATQSIGEPDEATIQRWRHRYLAGLDRLKQAGVRTIRNEQEGAETYIALRARWDRYIKAFADHMAHDMVNIDPVGANPKSVRDRQQFDLRLRSAG